MLIVTRADARTLIVCTPTGFERYFDLMSARAAGVEPPAEAMEPWPEPYNGRSTHRRVSGWAVIRAPAYNSPEEGPRGLIAAHYSCYTRSIGWNIGPFCMLRVDD
jgi:hypothetical protein